MLNGHVKRKRRNSQALFSKLQCAVFLPDRFNTWQTRGKMVNETKLFFSHLVSLNASISNEKEKER